ncbi:DUF362 domain-containing protein [Alkaliphilus peptidifermentans]|uniref:Ferredoxin n=1 Tax=Alkaliphilus peptidifermentans DSM 18978 TaxID=1120976 RepID=A0A1G5K406_9FIRM|nr:DUF362 domain-containing protein [Alkaliphilus peptidifermentans]SCY94589.1 Uncharacterized conserved protein, DUF362 family [Alkaliphilus peptidifermentans DSM 18978]
MKTVAITKSIDYEYDNVRRALEESVFYLGGLDKYVKKGQRVLLKLNLLMKKKPEEAVTTHPIFVKALGDLLTEFGCEVIVGDSPAGPYTVKHLEGIYRACGIEDIANEGGFILNKNIEVIEEDYPEGEVIKKIDLIKIVKEVDVVISVSKLKTHGMAVFTGAVKNMFGVIPGLQKVDYHFKMPDVHQFCNMLVDVCSFVKPTLSFMDGIIGMEGEGPSAGNPREVGLVLASESPYHLDAVAAKIIGINPVDIPSVRSCIERGFIDENLVDCQIKGLLIEECKVEKFKVPSMNSIHFIKGRVPVFLENILMNTLQPKPVFVHKDCIGCRDCEVSCPPDAITMINNKPYVDLKKCIRCFCCQELCPKKAVLIKRKKLVDRLLRM